MPCSSYLLLAHRYCVLANVKLRIGGTQVGVRWPQLMRRHVCSARTCTVRGAIVCGRRVTSDRLRGVVYGRRGKAPSSAPASTSRGCQTNAHGAGAEQPLGAATYEVRRNANFHTHRLRADKQNERCLATPLARKRTRPPLALKRGPHALTLTLWIRAKGEVWSRMG